MDISYGKLVKTIDRCSWHVKENVGKERNFARPSLNEITGSLRQLSLIRGKIISLVCFGSSVSRALNSDFPSYLGLYECMTLIR